MVSSEVPVPVVRMIAVDDDGCALLLRRANTAYGEGG